LKGQSRMLAYYGIPCAMSSALAKSTNSIWQQPGASMTSFINMY
jgi:hypothetical protein